MSEPARPFCKVDYTRYFILSLAIYLGFVCEFQHKGAGGTAAHDSAHCESRSITETWRLETPHRTNFLKRWVDPIRYIRLSTGRESDSDTNTRRTYLRAQLYAVPF